MPPILGLKTPLPVLAQSADLIRPATGIEAVRPLAADGRCFAGVLSSDKGLAYHVLLERGVPLPAAVAEPAPPRQTRLPPHRRWGLDRFQVLDPPRLPGAFCGSERALKMP